MKPYEKFSKESLVARKAEVVAQYENIKNLGLKLDMSRGKPCPEQLDLSNEMYAAQSDFKALDGTDCRNYGLVDGLPEAKKLFAELFNISTDEIIVAGNSSLNLMYDTLVRCYLHKMPGIPTPWSQLEKVKFLCPVPGYDRHFAITELLGVEMINIPMNSQGPDMDLIENLVANDDAIKGIWCVPKYSNPSGISYSDATVKRFASMNTAAPDFRIIWDNSYDQHHLNEKSDEILDIIDECKKAGNPERVFLFSSTSKITWSGAGISFIAASKTNIDQMKKLMGIQTIGHNKTTQLLHVRFLKSVANIDEHMKLHAKILSPKFEMVLNILDAKLGDIGVATWNKPNGGYFISLDVVPQTAKRVVQLAKEAGVVLTPAGATYPYGKDPLDANIRIAPTFPPLNELEKAIDVLCLCVEYATLEKISE